MADYRLKYITNIARNNIMLSNHKRIPFKGEFEEVLVNDKLPKNLRRPIQRWHIWDIDESKLNSSIVGWSTVGADYFFTVLSPIEYNLYAMTSASSDLVVKQHFNVYRNLLVDSNLVPIIVLQTIAYKQGTLRLMPGLSDTQRIYEKLEQFYSEHKADITKFMFMTGGTL